MLGWLSSLRRYGPLFRGALILLATLAGIYWFLDAVGAHYPVGQWLFWTYAKVWAVCALFAASCLAGGQLLLRVCGFRTMRLRERAVMAFAAGVLLFFSLMFVGGLIGLYGSVFAVALPTLLIVAGGAYDWRQRRRVFRHLRAFRARPGRKPPWWTLPVLAFGLLGVLLVYLPILSPRNVAFDSTFYHLGIAQQYATQGGIYATPEGWTPTALPHLASVLYSWTFIFPGLGPMEHVLAAAHLEFVVFLATLASVPLLVRWLVPRAGRLTWVTVFLFPGIWVYDSNLSAAADHINAFWAIPIFLALRRAMRTLSPRDSGLLAAMLAGAALTKYQAMYLLAFPLLAYTAAALWSLVSAFRKGRKAALLDMLRRAAGSIGVAVALGVLLTAPHWLKNWAFYGDPLYPYLHRYFPSEAWGADLGELHADWAHWQLTRWQPKGTLTDKLSETVHAMAYFSVEPHDWPKFHGKWPVFGSLFTLCAAPLLFVRGSKRTWALVVASYMGLAIWYWTMHQDRYLQVLVPWMACVVAATIALVWRSHWLARPALLALVGAQVVWGADAPAIPSHVMTKAPPVRTALDLLATGYKKRYVGRYAVSSPFFKMGQDPALPPNATLLLHEHNPRLGLWRPVIADIAGWQYGLRYDQFESPAALDGKLRAFGITHIASRTTKSRSLDSLAADLHYFDYLKRHAKLVKKFGGWGIYALAPEAPAATPYGKLLYLGCSKQYQLGLHDSSAVNIRGPQVKRRHPKRVVALQAADPGDYGALIEHAQFVATSDKCPRKLPLTALAEFEHIASRKHEKLWSRK